MATEQSTDTVKLEDNSAEDAHTIKALLTKHGISQERVDELKGTYPHLFMLVDAPVIFRPLKGAEFDRVAHKKEHADRAKSLKELASFIVVEPDAIGWTRLLQDHRYALIWTTVTEAAVAIASAKETTEAKKL